MMTAELYGLKTDYTSRNGEMTSMVFSIKTPDQLIHRIPVYPEIESLGKDDDFEYQKLLILLALPRCGLDDLEDEEEPHYQITFPHTKYQKVVLTYNQECFTLHLDTVLLIKMESSFRFYEETIEGLLEGFKMPPPSLFRPPPSRLPLPPSPILAPTSPPSLLEETLPEESSSKSQKIDPETSALDK